ncbi:hypothetical protein HOE07_05105 [archaeon]|nr:hypothetical protein [archaeon]
MIIYGPQGEKMRKLKETEEILEQVSTKHCFITGSYLYKKKYRDIDMFVITRSKKKFKVRNKKAKISFIDFNDLHSLFYHSISKSCVSKGVLPKKDLKVTISDYWQVVNEAVPTIMNRKNKYHKDIRFLVLYTEYFRTGEVLDTFQLDSKIKSFKNYKEILTYIDREVPLVINKKIKKSYLRRFFYTQAGFYKGINYKAQRFLYELSHKITRGIYCG